MSTVYLHIGMPKTGTSYLQSFLRLNEKVLNEKGISFPCFEHQYPNVSPDRNAFFLKRKTRVSSQGPEFAERIYQQNLHYIFSLKDQFSKIILTDESLWNDKDINWNNLKKNFMHIDCNLKIIVYLRRQDAFAQSLWAQKVKAGYPDSFTAFLESSFFHSYNLDYYHVLSKIAGAIGKENLIVKTYDMKRLKNENKTITSEFLDIIGLKEDESFVHPVKERINPSLSGIYLETKRLLNSHPEFATNRNWGTQLLITIIEERKDYIDFNSNQFIDFRTCNLLTKKYKRSNQLVAKEFLNQKDGKLFDQLPEKKYNFKAKKYTASDFVDVLAEMLILQQKNIEALTNRDSSI